MLRETGAILSHPPDIQAKSSANLPLLNLYRVRHLAPVLAEQERTLYKLWVLSEAPTFEFCPRPRLLRGNTAWRLKEDAA